MSASSVLHTCISKCKKPVQRTNNRSDKRQALTGSCIWMLNMQFRILPPGLSLKPPKHMLSVLLIKENPYLKGKITESQLDWFDFPLLRQRTLQLQVNSNVAQAGQNNRNINAAAFKKYHQFEADNFDDILSDTLEEAAVQFLMLLYQNASFEKVSKQLCTFIIFCHLVFAI